VPAQAMVMLMEILWIEFYKSYPFKIHYESVMTILTLKDEAKPNRMAGFFGTYQKRNIEMSKEQKLADKRIAILLEDGFDKDEYQLVRDIAEGAGAKVQVVSSGNLEVRPYEESNANRSKSVNVDSSHTEESTYDGVLLVSGKIEHSQMAEKDAIKSFIEREFEAHTPIVAVGSGEKILENTDVFQEIGAPRNGEDTNSIIRSQDVMYAKTLKDEKKFPDELIDFLTRS
jgi:hypothetical protein